MPITYSIYNSLNKIIISRIQANLETSILWRKDLNTLVCDCRIIKIKFPAQFLVRVFSCIKQNKFSNQISFFISKCVTQWVTKENIKIHIASKITIKLRRLHKPGLEQPFNLTVSSLHSHKLSAYRKPDLLLKKIRTAFFIHGLSWNWIFWRSSGP